MVERKTISIMKACELVGVSRRTIYNWLSSGKIEYVRTAGGWKIEIPNSVILDDAKDGVHDPQTGAQNMQNLASNPNVIAVIGPQNSSVAKVQMRSA